MPWFGISPQYAGILRFISILISGRRDSNNASVSAAFSNIVRASRDITSFLHCLLLFFKAAITL